jgi:hypothetical protein
MHYACVAAAFLAIVTAAQVPSCNGRRQALPSLHRAAAAGGWLRMIMITILTLDAIATHYQ